MQRYSRRCEHAQWQCTGDITSCPSLTKPDPRLTQYLKQVVLCKFWVWFRSCFFRVCYAKQEMHGVLYTKIIMSPQLRGFGPFYNQFIIYVYIGPLSIGHSISNNIYIYSTSYNILR